MNRITDAIAADHSDLLVCSNRITEIENADEQNRFQNQLIWELARHVVGEELVLYPALEEHLREEDPALEDRDRNETIKEQLQVFQNLRSSDPRFIPTLTILMDEVATHIHHEETVDLVKLENAVTAEESKRLARLFDRTKLFAPTRAHPERSPYETAVALVMAPLDHLQDLFRRWPKGDTNPSPPMG